MILEAEVRNPMDTSETDTSPWSRGTPHWGQIPLPISNTYIFIEDTLLLQNSWGLPCQDSFPEAWIYIQRLIFMKSKAVILFSSRNCFFQLAPSFFQRWKIFPLKALQWELKTLFQRGWALLIHPSVLTRTIFAEGHNKYLSYSHANSSAGE